MEVEPKKADFSFISSTLSPEEATSLRVYLSGKSLLLGSFSVYQKLVAMEEYALSENSSELHSIQLFRRFKDSFQNLERAQLILGSLGITAVPRGSFSSENRKLILENTTEMEDHSQILNSSIGSVDFVYTCNQEVIGAFKSAFPVADGLSTSFVSAKKFSEGRTTSGPTLFCFVHPQAMDIWLVNEDKLMLFNRFQCDMVADYGYNVLNCGQQMGWSAKTDTLVVFGYESRMNDILRLLKGYVQNVQTNFANNAPEVERLTLLQS